MKIGIIKKDKTKIEIESKHIQIIDYDSETLSILYLVNEELSMTGKSMDIPKKDIQLIYFGGWND